MQISLLKVGAKFMGKFYAVFLKIKTLSTCLQLKIIKR